MLDSVKYWLRDQEIQNFGDALTRIYMDRLFLPIGSQATSVHLVGSVIDDMFVEDARKEHAGARPVFWGCGIRTEGGLSEQNRSLAKILSVRGPISARALNVEGKVPIGDSALLLPAIYTPSSGREGSNKTICIPHFHDDRSDEELLTLSKCDVVLRSSLGPDLPDIYNTIDQIVSARFVFSASLHGAIVAVAYGRPFCFWDNGSIDLPLKWQDFAASIGIPCLFAKDISEAIAVYEANLRSKIKLPPILPLALAAPFVVHADAMANILRRASGDCEPELEQLATEASPVAKANRMLMDAIVAAQKMRQQNDQLNMDLDVLRLKELADQESKEQEQKLREKEARASFEASQRYAQINSLLNSRERDRKSIIKKPDIQVAGSALRKTHSTFRIIRGRLVSSLLSGCASREERRQALHYERSV